jgi:hypothetical protein
MAWIIRQMCDFRRLAGMGMETIPLAACSRPPPPAAVRPGEARLRGVRVPRDALADVASHAMGDWFLRGNPRPVRDVSELQQVLEQSW